MTNMAKTVITSTTWRYAEGTSGADGGSRYDVPPSERAPLAISEWALLPHASRHIRHVPGRTGTPSQTATVVVT